MLALKISDKFVDLPNDFAFTMNLKSPMFGDVGSYSYPFKIPASLRNKIILNFPHREAGISDPFVDRPGIFEWNGIPLFSGNARLKSAANNAYEGAVFEANGDFYFQLQNKSLQQVDLGEMVFASETAGLNYLKTTIGGYYPTFPLTCPLFYNPTYFDPATTTDELKYYNYHYPTSIFRNLTLSSNEKTVIVPMLYLRYVLEKLFAGIGYNLNDQVFTAHADFNRLVLYNATNCNNSGTNTPPRLPENYTLAHLIFNYHVPRVKINDFLKGLFNYLGIAMFVDNVTRTVTLKTLKDITTGSDYVEFSSGIISTRKDYEERPGGFTLTMAIYDDYMQALRDYDDTKIKLFAGSVPTYADLPVWPVAEIGTEYFVEDTQLTYKLNYDKTWISWSQSMWTQWVFRNGNEKIESTFSTIDGFQSDPYGSISGLMTEYRDVMPYLFFAKNSVNGSAGPTPHNTITDRSLLYSAQNPYSMIWQNWIDFFKFRDTSNLVKFQKQMTFSEIKNFDFSKKIMINGVKYLVKSIQVTLRKDRIMPATLECYICN